MEKTYQYTMEGSGAGGQTWTTTGAVTLEFHRAFDAVMRDTFEKLTSGMAIYGRPGIGCSGPYDITRLVIEQVKQ